MMMKRFFSLLGLLMLLIAGITYAQTNQSKPITTPIEITLLGDYEPIQLQPVQPPPTTFNPDNLFAGAASPQCGLATTLGINTNGVPDGGQTIVNGAEEEAFDPPLNCVYGDPVGPRGNRGYRTVWYQFTAPQSGLVTLKAFPNADYRENYDTIIAVYPQSDCNILSPALACNDDHNGFLSETSVAVTQNQAYLVEIADWQFGASSSKKLNLTVTFQPVDSLWQLVGDVPEFRTYHSVSIVDDQIYMIAGETTATGNPIRTGTMHRYDLSDGAWTQLPTLPGPDGRGYSRTDAVHLEGKIYLPSGYVGNNNLYDGTHWVYDIAASTWVTATPNPHWENGAAYAYEQVVGVETPIPQYYVVGGLTGEFLAGTPHADMYVYLAGSDLWLNPNRPMNTARYAHVAEKIGNSICVAGGLGADGNGSPIILSSTECYSIISGQWTNVGAMNFFRFNAGSAVGPNGKWYVWGGTSATGQSLSTIEVFDPTTGVWTVLPAQYDLLNPSRAWAKGGFIGNDLWVLGGHLNTGSGDLVMGLMERAMIPDAVPANYILYHPIIFNGQLAPPNEVMGTALPLSFYINYFNSFATVDDFFDWYYFDLPEQGTVQVFLESIDIQQAYNLEVYDSNKLWLGSGQNIGNQNEHLILPDLPAGRYFVQVIRDFGQPTQDPYVIRVER